MRRGKTFIVSGPSGVGKSTDVYKRQVVVIVSEETGSISVAIGGMLKRHLKPETLENLLRNELLPQDGEDPARQKFSLAGLWDAMTARRNGGSHED